MRYSVGVTMPISSVATSMSSRWWTKLEDITFLAFLGFVTALQISIAAANILLSITLLGWAIVMARRAERPQFPLIFWPLLAYAATTLISAAYSLDVTASLVDSKQLLLFLIVPAVYHIARGQRASTTITVIISVGAISAVVGIFQYGILEYDNLGRRPQGSLTHYMTYSGLLMLVACVAAARILFRRNQRIWPSLIMPTLLVALALTFTRSAWVGACVALALLLAFKDFRLMAILPIFAALFFAVAPTSVTNRAYSILDLKDPTNRDRLAMLRTGANIVSDHPWTGVGPDMIKKVYTSYRDPMAVEAINFHLHNVPLQIAAERGLFALATWIWFVGIALIHLVKKLRSSVYPAIAASGLATIAAMLAAGLFEYNFGDSEFLMLFLVLVTLPFAADRPEPAST